MRKSILPNMSKERYLEYLKMLPDMRKQKNRDYTMLVLTFFAAAFFGFFAINPTLSTITRLQKELDDSKFVNISLETKIANMSNLLSQQTSIASDLPYVLNAVPTTANAALFAAQLQQIATDKKLVIYDIQTTLVQLAPVKNVKEESKKYEFSITVSGSDDAFLQFLTTLKSFDRLLSVKEITYGAATTNETKSLTVKGITYFLP